MTEPKVVRRPARFGSALPPDQMIQKYSRSDPNWYVPFITKEDDFPSWSIAIGLMASAGLGCWGLWHLALWAGRL